jgi:hypothetical protein
MRVVAAYAAIQVAPSSLDSLARSGRLYVNRTENDDALHTLYVGLPEKTYNSISTKSL